MTVLDRIEQQARDWARTTGMVSVESADVLSLVNIAKAAQALIAHEDDETQHGWFAEHDRVLNALRAALSVVGDKEGQPDEPA